MFAALKCSREGEGLSSLVLHCISWHRGEHQCRTSTKDDEIAQKPAAGFAQCSAFSGPQATRGLCITGLEAWAAGTLVAVPRCLVLEEGEGSNST